MTIKPLSFKKILLTIDVDDSEANQKAFRYAITQAKEFNAALKIGSVFERNDLNILDSVDPDKITEKRNTLAAVVEKYVQLAEKFGVENVVGITSEGEGIYNEIIDTMVPNLQPQLLVCGADEKGEHRNSSISVKLAKKAKIFVIIVR